MRLWSIWLLPLPVEGVMKQVGEEDVYVTLPWGWYAHLVLEEVPPLEFHYLREMAAGVFMGLAFQNNQEPYDFKNQRTWVFVEDQKLIWEYVRQGAFWEPRVMRELGEKLVARIKAEIQRRSQG